MKTFTINLSILLFIILLTTNLSKAQNPLLNYQHPFFDALQLNKEYSSHNYIQFFKILHKYCSKNRNDTVFYFQIANELENNPFFGQKIKTANDSIQTSNKKIHDSIQICFNNIKNLVYLKEELINNEVEFIKNQDTSKGKILLLEFNSIIESKQYTRISDTILRENINIINENILKLYRKSIKLEKNKIGKMRTQKNFVEFDTWIQKSSPEKQQFSPKAIDNYSGDIASENTQPIFINVSGSSSFQSNLIDATATFIVERMKEEINIAFLNKFRDKITGVKFNDLRILFPNTYKFLKVVEPYNYSQSFIFLQNTIKTDLQNITFKLPELLKQYKISNDKIKYISYLADLFQKLENRDNIHPVKIIETLQKFDPDYLPFQYLNLISESLRDIAGNNYWITEANFEKLNNEEIRKFYYGLLWYNLSHNIKISNNDSTAIISTIAPFYTLASNLDNEIKELTQITKTGTKIPIEKYVSLLEDNLQIIELPFKFFENKKSSLNIAPEIKKMFFQIYTASKKNDYGVLLSNTLLLLDTICEGKIKKSQDLIKYSSFMVALTQAKSSKDMKNIIQSFALPAGSYSIKRNSLQNISLNAYGGISYGHGTFDFKKETYLAFTAPIGIQYSISCRKTDSNAVEKYKNFYHYTTSDTISKAVTGNSFSIFLSVVDLGAVAQFRFQNDSASLPNDITFKDVFLPGLMLGYNIRKCPLTILGGVQYSPILNKLHYANDRTTVFRTLNVLKIYLGVVIDIPLINIFTKTEK